MADAKPPGPAGTPPMDDMLPEDEMHREMAADTGYRDYVVAEAVDDGDGWEVRLQKSSMEWTRIRKNLAARPREGDAVRVFGDGDGFPIRGIAINRTRGSTKFSGVYYRRLAIRCACGDYGWNHPGGGQCRRRSRVDDETWEDCRCQKYDPRPAPAAPVEPTTAVGSLLGAGDTLAAIVGPDRPAAPVEARVAESVPPINSRPEIGPVNRRAEVDAWPAIGAPAAAGPGAATVEDAATVSAAGAIAQSTPEPLPFVASRGELGAPGTYTDDGDIGDRVVVGVDQTGRILFTEPAPLVEHPGPWRWVDNYWTMELQDANDKVLIEEKTGRDRLRSLPRVRALTEAAPEMEAMLRELEWSLLPELRCPVCGGARPGSPAATHFRTGHLDCDLAALLARLDAAAKAGR